MNREICELIIVDILFFISFLIGIINLKHLSSKNDIIYDRSLAVGRAIAVAAFINVSLMTIVFNFVWIFNIIGGMN